MNVVNFELRFKTAAEQKRMKGGGATAELRVFVFVVCLPNQTTKLVVRRRPLVRNNFDSN